MILSYVRLVASVAAGLVVGGASAAVAQTAVVPAAEDYINPDRPGIADGSNVVGTGRFQVEMGLQEEFRRNDGARERTLFVPTLLRLGLSQDWELRVETNAYIWDRVRDPATGVSKSEGASTGSLGVKYHFMDSAGLQQPSLRTKIGR